MLWQSLWSIRKRLPHPRKYRLPIEENIEEPFTRNDYRKQAIYGNGFHKSTQYDRRMALKTFGCVMGNGWCFISWNSKGIANKMPQLWNPSTKNLRKILYFHHTVEIKQPYTMTEPLENHRKGECFDRVAWYGEKTLFRVCWRPPWVKYLALLYNCFISTVRWKIQPFFRFFPWRNP